MHRARDWGTHLPESFGELKSFIGETVAEILVDRDPVVIVNGSKESDYDAMDFQRRPYWRIMVGGAKLSRGFTVEGLTVSYYRRRASAADTLMQMGRWFGYRPGYRDLVRLYIGRDVVDGRGTSFDLYDMFTSILQDEEEFRDQLRAFSEVDADGRPRVKPSQVPPMVFAQLSWLKPTATNRMYNAMLVEMARGGVVMDRFNVPARSEGLHAANFKAVASLLEGYQLRCLRETDALPDRVFSARVAVRSSAEVRDALTALKWARGKDIKPDIGFLLNAMSKGDINDWAIITPELTESVRRDVGGLSRLPIIQRKRRWAPRSDFSGSEPKHRGVLQYISGRPDVHSYEPADGLPELGGDGRTRGAILLNFGYESESGDFKPVESAAPLDPADVVSLLTIVYPYWSAPRGRIAFQVANPAREDDVIVDARSA